MDCGTEIHLFDAERKPQDWTELIRPTECTIFLKDRTTSAPVAPDGRAYPSPAQCTCIVFDRLDATQRFGLKHRERERLKRVEEHRNMEKGDA